MTRAEELFTRMHYTRELTNEEILELEKEVHDFFQSDEPEEDKEELGSCIECLFMLCNAIREGYLEDRTPSKPKLPKKEYTFKPEIPEFLRPKEKNNIQT